jgi:hypothetical protein
MRRYTLHLEASTTLSVLDIGLANHLQRFAHDRAYLKHAEDLDPNEPQ